MRMPTRHAGSAPGRPNALPLVSIITPSFNQARFLPATLRSVAEQSHGRIEHIVLDGGSTDGSVEIIREWAAVNPIIWRSEPDEGQADAIRRGAEMATGEIVAWLNSDDVYLDRSVVADVVELFQAGAKIVTGGGWYLDESGHRVERIPVFPDRLGHDPLKHVDWILQPATFVRRDLFLSCPIDTSLHFAFDWDLFIRLTAKVTPTPILRELAGYRRHGSGKTVSGGSRRQRELLIVTRRYQGRYSLGSLLLTPVVAAYGFADRLPPSIGRKVVGALTRFAKLTQLLRNGRGIQY
jgi:Glycosyltransferases involved in cell wall biogenesis